jgi:thiosulfate dehydrogenase (quinone) large subunit
MNSMKLNPTQGIAYLLLFIGALVTAVRLVVVFSGTADGFWTSGTWELLMVLLMAASLVYVLAAGFVNRPQVPATEPGFQDPAAIRFLLDNPKSATFWTMVRFYVGFEWFAAGYQKVIGKEGDWMTNGAALKGFWTAVPALNHKGSNPALAYDWWYNFLDYMTKHEWYTWFGKVIALGESAVGIALILGALVGIAAFFGGAMNFSYMLTGVAGVNPLMFVLTLGLIVGWKVAGYYGADRYLLSMLGTPWHPGSLVAHRPTVKPTRLAS